jgi:N utilization substance protein B
MKLVYQMTLLNDYSNDEIEPFLNEHKEDAFDEVYFRMALKALLDNRASIDESITNASPKWRIDRMSKVDLSIIRLALAEINYLESIPAKVSINEAIELAKLFGSDTTPNFVNGILGEIVRKAV